MRLSLAPLGDEVYSAGMGCSSGTSVDGGYSFLKENPGAPVEAVAEFGDMVGVRDDAEDVNEDLLEYPSVFMFANRDLLAPECPMTSSYSSSSTSTATSSKSTIAVGADAGSGTTDVSTSSITFNELAL